MEGKIKVCTKGKYAYVRGEHGSYLCRGNLETGEIDGEMQYVRHLTPIMMR